LSLRRGAPQPLDRFDQQFAAEECTMLREHQHRFRQPEAKHHRAAGSRTPSPASRADKVEGRVVYIDTEGASPLFASP
jgi:hypothetical protein